MLQYDKKQWCSELCPKHPVPFKTTELSIFDHFIYEIICMCAVYFHAKLQTCPFYFGHWLSAHVVYSSYNWSKQAVTRVTQHSSAMHFPLHPCVPLALNISNRLPYCDTNMYIDFKWTHVAERGNMLHWQILHSFLRGSQFPTQAEGCKHLPR